MNVKKIINRILLEANETGYTDVMGRPLVSTFGGDEITDVTQLGNLPSFDKMDVSVFDDFCNRKIKDQTSKFYKKTFQECSDVQKKMLWDIQNVGAPNGVRSFNWKGQRFTACYKRNKEKETLAFSGYYGNLDSKRNCFAPEWFYMIQQDKKRTKDGGKGTPGTSKGLTIAGPDFK